MLQFLHYNIDERQIIGAHNIQDIFTWVYDQHTFVSTVILHFQCSQSSISLTFQSCFVNFLSFINSSLWCMASSRDKAPPHSSCCGGTSLDDMIRFSGLTRKNTTIRLLCTASDELISLVTGGAWFSNFVTLWTWLFGNTTNLLGNVWTLRMIQMWWILLSMMR